MSSTKKILSIYWHHAWKYPIYVIGLIFGVPATILIHQFLPPLITADVLDRISSGDFTKGDLWGSFGPSLLTYAFLVMLGGIFMWRIIIFLIWRLEAYVMRDLYRTQFNHLISLSAKFHADSFGGSLVSQTNKLSNSYVRIADTLVFQVTTMISGLVFTSVIMWPRSPLFVISTLSLSFVFMVLAYFLTKPIRDLVADEAKAQNKQTGVLADAITNIMAVKSFAADKQERQRFSDASESVRTKTDTVMWASLKRDAVFGTVTSSISALALIVAAASVALFDAEIGTVFLMVSFTMSITQSLWTFSQSTLRNFNRALGDAKEGAETLFTEQSVKDQSHPEKSKISKGKIEFNEVDFSHSDSRDQDVLFEKLNLTIKSGQKIGLVGHSGSGKTTLTKILLRFDDINGGKILIDGQSISKIRQNELRRSIAYVPQEPLLFHRSISENIAYGFEEDVSEEQIITAAKLANAHEFIEKLQDGYDTLVGERGVKLSGGQRQRVAIARALIKDAPILVLDEATSALDSESEQLIQDALNNLMKGRTAIVIAHRLSTIQRMDRIVVMEEGKILESGSHKELISQKGKYSELWSHQTGGFIEE